MLQELVTLTGLAEGSPQSFKVRAYEKASLGLQADGRDLTTLSMKELVAIDGVGKATANSELDWTPNRSIHRPQTWHRTRL